MNKHIIVVLGLLSVVLFCVHLFFGAQASFNIDRYTPATVVLAWCCFAAIGLHALVALWDTIRLSWHTRREHKYQKFTIENTIQIVSGVCIIVSAAIHIIFAIISFSPQAHAEKLIWYINNYFLYTMLFIHLSVTIPHLFISLGIITDERTYKTLKIIVYSVIVLLFLVALFSNIYVRSWYR